MAVDQILRNLPAVFAALLVAILFLQSGLDKVFDWKGNLGWLTGHFAKTLLAPMVPTMLATITVMELAAGFLAAAGIIYFLAAGSLVMIFWAAACGAASITALFFGQRMAKDYPGAAVLIPYFILLLILMFLTNPYVRLTA
ncbi:MAG: DoxX family protein [Acidobacteriota bacterium]